MNTTQNLFPERRELFPQIYIYQDTNPQFEGYLKVGYTTRESALARIQEQYPINAPGVERFKFLGAFPAVRNDGSTFTDKAVHAVLKKKKISSLPNSEFFKCSLEEVKAAIISVQERKENKENRTLNFGMRPEQQEAVNSTIAYFQEMREKEPNYTPRFLWNAKMRFGKTFAAYQLAKAMNWKRVLVLTFKPAVKSAWEEDITQHIDFEGWQFISKNKDFDASKIDRSKPFVCFGSFQDYLGKQANGDAKERNKWVYEFNWDCIIFDEYHYGAWRERAKELFEADYDDDSEKTLEAFDEETIPITAHHFLYLSGTPFRAINNGEFLEDQIFNWTYQEEQKAKATWEGPDNPYLSLPRMVMLTYELPEEIKTVTGETDLDGFDLNEFFKAKQEGINGHRFVHEAEVQKWLSFLMKSELSATGLSIPRVGNEAILPFNDTVLLKVLNHTVWFLPTVGACKAMKQLLESPQNIFFHEYNIVVAAGVEGGMGAKAIEPVKMAMENPLKSKSITLSCGKLMTGVSIKPWTGIFMLRNLTSPETYFQAAFRVQTPWTTKDEEGKEVILKEECYVFDFAPNRALSQIANYCSSLSENNDSLEKTITEFINFFPVLAFNGTQMSALDATGILDFAHSGTTGTLLAKRWESALLVNVDNYTLEKLLKNKEAMEILMSIEGFRSLNDDIETIISRAGSIKDLKKKISEDGEDKIKAKKQLTEEEKEYKSKRKEIQEKLIKFATRIPIFMYLSEFREFKLQDVITQLEPELFYKVTGLTIKDFELLVSLNLFNSTEMNNAVFGFRRYEEASFNYVQFDDYIIEDERVGGFDSTLSRAEL